MKEIPLSGNKVAIVDDEDYEMVSKYGWSFCPSGTDGKYWYASTSAYHNGKRLFMHRLVLNAEPGQEIDHINHNGLDNRKANLRFCTRRDNGANRKIQSHSSRYKGVDWYAPRHKWRARIQANHIGLFTTEEEAARAYDAKAKELFGEYAKLNFED